MEQNKKTEIKILIIFTIMLLFLLLFMYHEAYIISAGLPANTINAILTTSIIFSIICTPFALLGTYFLYKKLKQVEMNAAH